MVFSMTDATKYESSGSLADVMIDMIEKFAGLDPVLGEPVWGFMSVEIDDEGYGKSGVEIARDSLEECDAFLMTRNARPVAVAIKNETGAFEVRTMDVEWTGRPEDNPELFYDEMAIEGL
jgi:hypothetical protein